MKKIAQRLIGMGVGLCVMVWGVGVKAKEGVEKKVWEAEWVEVSGLVIAIAGLTSGIWAYFLQQDKKANRLEIEKMTNEMIEAAIAKSLNEFAEEGERSAGNVQQQFERLIEQNTLFYKEFSFSLKEINERSNQANKELSRAIKDINQIIIATRNEINEKFVSTREVLSEHRVHLERIETKLTGDINQGLNSVRHDLSTYKIESEGKLKLLSLEVSTRLQVLEKVLSNDTIKSDR